MGKTLTFEEKENIFLKKLVERYPDYTVADGYRFIDNNEFVYLEHSPTGEIWKTKPRYLDGKRQTPGVARKSIKFSSKKYTQEEFEKSFYNKFSSEEYSVIGEYKSRKDLIDIKHNLCGRIFKGYPSNLLNSTVKRGCTLCYGKKKKSVDEYQEIFNNNIELKHYTIHSVNTKNGHVYGKMTHNCEKCNNHTFSIRISDMTSSHTQRCPKCNMLTVESRAVREITEYLDINNIKYEKEKTIDGLVYKSSLRMDFYLPEYNVYIEYDGAQHFKRSTWYTEEQFKECKHRDNLKTSFCKENSLNLYRIKYNEDHINKLKIILQKNFMAQLKSI